MEHAQHDHASCGETAPHADHCAHHEHDEATPADCCEAHGDDPGSAA
ncbi:hypothetical protein AB0395_34505 [Streptosporangium sp. NPDC051023]